MAVVGIAGAMMTWSCEDGGAISQPPADAAALKPPADAGDARTTEGPPSPECGTQSWSPLSCGATACGAGQECNGQGRCECINGIVARNTTYTCDPTTSRGCADGACRCSVYGTEGAGEPCGGRSRTCSVGVEYDGCTPDGRCIIGNEIPSGCSNGITRMRGSRSGIAYQCRAGYNNDDRLVRIMTTANGTFTTVACAAQGIDDFVSDGSRIIARIGSKLIACDGAGSHAIVSGSPIARFAVGGANVYWLTDENTLFVCPTSGCQGVPKELTTFATTPTLIEADASGAYVATGSSLVRVDAATAEVTDLYSDGADTGVIDAFVADDDTIWFAEGGAIFSCPKAGCAGARKSFAAGSGPLSVDATRVWFVENQLVWGCAKAAPCLSPAKAIGYHADFSAADETTLYDGALLRFKKTFF